ncbi:hypothetical protein ACET3Z_014167 [Daucus carota]
MFADSGISSCISNSRLNNLGISGRMNKNAQSYLTPSQRRLRNVDFTSPSQCFPSSRLLNRSTGGADQCMPFQMPASTIRKPVTSQPNAAGARLVIYFRISDGSISHKVSFYGPINDDTGALYADNLEFPVILVLTSIRMTFYKGTIQISNLPQTRIFINPDHEGVYSLKQRLLDDGYQHQVFGN